MSTALYQKYRPQQFSAIVGQEHVRTTLVNELKSGHVSHAYLFSGPRGVGKTTAARLLARAVNCEHPKEGEPCLECPSCVAIQRGATLDVVEIDAASHTGVDHVRENIIDNARVAPSQLRWKVFIIDEVHMLSTSAFNALLKTLEEPPEHTLFILATTELHKVPATIISRCERFQFRRIGYDDLVARVRDLAHREDVAVDDDVVFSIVKRSEGSLRDAESLLGQVLSLDGKRITADVAAMVLPRTAVHDCITLWEQVVRGQTAAAILHVNSLLEQGVMLIEFTKEMIDVLRKILLYMVQEQLAPLEFLNVDSSELQQLQEVARQTSIDRMVKMIDVFTLAFEQQKLSTIPQLPLELALVRLTLGGGAPVHPPTASPHQPTLSTISTVPTSGAPSTPLSLSQSTQSQQPLPDEDSTASSPPLAGSGQHQTVHALVPPSALSIDGIREQWSALLEQMKQRNHALHLTFKVARLVSFEDGVLTIGFQYQFYQDRIEDSRHRTPIDQAFEHVFGAPLRLAVVIGPEYAPEQFLPVQNIEQPSQDEVANVWDLAAQTFGPNAKS